MRVGCTPLLATIFPILLVCPMAQVLRKWFFAFVNDFTTFVVCYPFKVSIVLPVDYLFSVDECVTASAMVRAGFCFNVRSFLTWAIGFHAKAVTQRHAFNNKHMIAALCAATTRTWFPLRWIV